MRLKDLFKPEWWSERLYREEWNIGIVDQTAEEIVQHGFRSAPRWLPRAERAMQADQPQQREDAIQHPALITSCDDEALGPC